MKKLFGTIPGILLLIAIGLLGRYAELSLAAYRAHHLSVPNIEGVIWDIFFGLIIANIFTLPKFFEPGIATYQTFLKLGIIFLGAKFLLGDIAKLGLKGLVLVPMVFLISTVTFVLLGKWFKLSKKQTILLAVGSSICGVSAIAATAPAIDATEEEQSTSMGAIVIMGAMSLGIFPLVGRLLHLSNSFFGMWVGFGVDNTAEVAATGALYSDAAGKIAVLTKSVRNAFIGPVALGCSIYFKSKTAAGSIKDKLFFLVKKFPLFVLGLVLVSALATAHVFDHAQIVGMVNFSRWMFWLTFAGVGLSLDFRSMSKQGLKALAVGALGELCSAVSAFFLVYGAYALLGW